MLIYREVMVFLRKRDKEQLQIFERVKCKIQNKETEEK